MAKRIILNFKFTATNDGQTLRSTLTSEFVNGFVSLTLLIVSGVKKNLVYWCYWIIESFIYLILVAFCHRIKTLKMLFLSTKLTWDLTQEVCVSLFPASAFIVFWGAKSAFNPAFRCSREERQSLDRNLITLQFRFRYFGVNRFFRSAEYFFSKLVINSLC